MDDIKVNSWVETLIEVYSSLGGEAHWDDVYPEAKRNRTAKGLSWTVKSEGTIRDCVQRHSSDSKSRKLRMLLTFSTLLPVATTAVGA